MEQYMFKVETINQVTCSGHLAAEIMCFSKFWEILFEFKNDIQKFYLIYYVNLTTCQRDKPLSDIMYYYI